MSSVGCVGRQEARPEFYWSSKPDRVVTLFRLVWIYDYDYDYDYTEQPDAIV
jgi:hypothetical protein